MSTPLSPVTPEALHALAEDLRVLNSKLRRRLREEAHVGDFTPSQVQVLTQLEREGPATVSALARAHGMRPQSMGETLAALKAAGLVSGTPDPNDGRQTVLSLTPSFRRKVKASRAAREDWLYRTIQTHFSPAEQQQLATGVDLLKRLVDS
ncbi:MarR family transcriptional regulator [Paraburkholderia sp. Ac-20336]|uniref:MarR family winged helix-turn-helix transcriptional regulator n=1 Tax=unclassified Paraburkholderia TaxID=2615204 RepID=UPI00197E80F4|nr:MULTISPECIES: MarR family transcriptional regulator [unclassified Paraburkholderia]MBN3806129.1 MarR family transcriptional regulator [Paraburkholderia sp. Ac-20336]MBN3849878.1 MarR family transcriptional regulator [Paraburkholderia sp. Ac-20342]